MQINEFLQNQKYVIPVKGPKVFRCIDDRYTADDIGEAHYAVPGASLGIVTDTISGYEIVLSKDLTDSQLEIVWNTAEEVFGTITFHDGKPHDETLHSPVGGCGYCAATLEGQANISQRSAAFLKDRKVTPQVQHGYKPVYFEEKHAASFVLFVMSDSIGIIPTAADGTRAYILHPDVHKEQMTKFAEAVYDKLIAANEMDPSISKATVVAAVLEAGKQRLDKVVTDLGAHLIPHYNVMQNGEIEKI